MIFAAKGKDDSSRVDRVQWKGMQNTMQDTTKFVDMLHNVSWGDGLPDDVLRGESNSIYLVVLDFDFDSIFKTTLFKFCNNILCALPCSLKICCTES